MSDTISCGGSGTITRAPKPCVNQSEIERESCPGCEHCDTEQPLNPCAVEWRPGDAPGISYGQLPGLEFMRVEYAGDVTIHSRPLSACHGDPPPWELLVTIRSA